MPNSSNFFNFNQPDLNPQADPNDLINQSPLSPQLVSLNTKRSLLDYKDPYEWSYQIDNPGEPTNIFGIDVYDVPGEQLMSYVDLDRQGQSPPEGYFWLGNNYSIPEDYTAHNFLFVKNPTTGYFSPVKKGGELSNMIAAYNTKWGKLVSDNFTGVQQYIQDTRDEYLKRRQQAILKAKHDYLENMWNTYGLNWNMADMPGDDFFAYQALGEGDYYELSKKYPNLLLFRRLDDDTDEANAPAQYIPQQLWDKDAVDLANNQRNMMTSFLLSDNYSNLANNTNPYSVSGQQLMNNMFNDAAFHYGLVGAASAALGGSGTGARTVGNALAKVANGRQAVGTAVSGLPGVRQVANAGRWLRDGYLAYAPNGVQNTVKAVRNVGGEVYNHLSPAGAINKLFGAGWTSEEVGAGNALYGAGKAAYNIGKDIYNGQAPSVENIGSIASASGIPYISTPQQLYKFFNTNMSNFSENPYDLENLYEATKNVSSALQ